MTGYNKRIREIQRIYKLKNYELAFILGKSESYITRMFRHELPEDEQRRIVAAIHQHEQEAGKHG